MEFNNDKFDGWRPVTMASVEDFLGDDAFKLNIFEKGALANFLGEVAVKHLEKGEIPCLAKIDEGGDTLSIETTMTPNQLKALWKIFTSMSEPEMDERIKMSGLYPDFD